jgi:hypothetical protein
LSNSREASRLIHELVSGGFYGTCPTCQQSFLLKDAGLFFMDELSPEAIVLLKEKRIDLRERAKALREREKNIPKRSEIQSEATNRQQKT